MLALPALGGGKLAQVSQYLHIKKKLTFYQYNKQLAKEHKLKQGNIVCEPNSSIGIENLFGALWEREEKKMDVIIPTRDMGNYLSPINIGTGSFEPMPYSGLAFTAGSELEGETRTFIPSEFFLEKFGAWADISQTYMRKMIGKIKVARTNVQESYVELKRAQESGRIGLTRGAGREAIRKENEASQMFNYYSSELNNLNKFLFEQVEHFFNYPATTRFDKDGNAPAHSRQLFRMLKNEGGDGSIRTMLSSKYKLLDDMPAIDALTRALENDLSGGGFYLDSAHVSNTSTRMKFVNTNLAVEIDGHPVNYMLDVVNSEVGSTSFKINQGYFYQWCTNGAIKQQITRAIHVGLSKDEFHSQDTLKKEGELLWAQIGDAVQASMTQETMDKMAVEIDNAKAVKFNQPELLAKDVTKKFKLSDYEGNSFLANLNKDSHQFGMNQWGASNALTSVAKSVKDYDRATELEQAGATLLAVPESYFTKHNKEVHVVPAGDVWERLER